MTHWGGVGGGGAAARHLHSSIKLALGFLTVSAKARERSAPEAPRPAVL